MVIGALGRVNDSTLDDAQFLIPKRIWDLLMGGLTSLDVTIGGSQTCSVALRGLMHKHGTYVLSGELDLDRF